MFLDYFYGPANRIFSFQSNLRIESAVYTTQAVTQPDGLQAYRAYRPIICWRHWRRLGPRFGGTRSGNFFCRPLQNVTSGGGTAEDSLYSWISIY